MSEENKTNTSNEDPFQDDPLTPVGEPIIKKKTSKKKTSKKVESKKAESKEDPKKPADVKQRTVSGPVKRAEEEEPKEEEKRFDPVKEAKNMSDKDIHQTLVQMCESSIQTVQGEYEKAEQARIVNPKEGERQKQLIDAHVIKYKSILKYLDKNKP